MDIVLEGSYIALMFHTSLHVSPQVLDATWADRIAAIYRKGYGSFPVFLFFVKGIIRYIKVAFLMDDLRKRKTALQYILKGYVWGILHVGASVPQVMSLARKHLYSQDTRLNKLQRKLTAVFAGNNPEALTSEKVRELIQAIQEFSSLQPYWFAGNLYPSVIQSGILNPQQELQLRMFLALKAQESDFLCTVVLENLSIQELSSPYLKPIYLPVIEKGLAFNLPVAYYYEGYRLFMSKAEPEKVKEMLEKSLNAGYGLAGTLLVMYLLSLSEDHPEYIETCSKILEQCRVYGNIPISYELGLVEDKKGNYATALQHYKDALTGSHQHTALVQIGWLYALGRGVPKDMQKALSLWKESQYFSSTPIPLPPSDCCCPESLQPSLHLAWFTSMVCPSDINNNR